MPWTFGIDAATYAASLLVIWWLPKLPPLEDVDRPSFRAIVDGFRFLKGRQALIGIFAIDTNAMVFGMPSALFPRSRFTGCTEPRRRSATSTRRRSGALACSLLSGWCSRVRRMGLGITVMACLWGASIAGFGFMTSLWPALLLLALAGGADFYSAVLRSTMLLRSTPDHLRGRLLGIEFMQVASAPSLGDLEAGVLASLTSLRFSIVSGGLACIAGCVVTALALPKFLSYDAGSDPQPSRRRARTDRAELLRGRGRRADRRGRGLPPGRPGLARVPAPPDRNATRRCSARRATPTSTAPTASTGASTSSAARGSRARS